MHHEIEFQIKNFFIIQIFKGLNSECSLHLGTCLNCNGKVKC